MRAARGLALALAFAGLLGCSLLIDTSDLDAGCPVGQKFCGRCVDENDPAYGCIQGVCTPCELANAVPACENGECVAKSCLYGYGCEKCTANILTEEAHCGGCRQPCAGGERCVMGVCSPESGQ